MILVSLILLSRSTYYHVNHSLKTVKSAFSEFGLLNQRIFLHQTCIDTLFADINEFNKLDFNDLDLIFKVTTALCIFKV